MPTAEDNTSPVDWTRRRRIAIGGYLAVLGVYVLVAGLPVDRIGMTAWIVVGLGTLSVGRGWRALRRVLLDWLPFQGILLAYDFSRGFAGKYDDGGLVPRDGSRNIIGAPLHTQLPIEVDRAMFGGTLPTQWMQSHLHHVGQSGWYTVLFSLSYTSHFLVTPLIAVALWIWRRDRFRAWVYCVLGLTAIGLTTYFVFPMTPPWLASQQGYIQGAPVGRYAGEGWEMLGLKLFARAVSFGQAEANLVAAMPSLHQAFSVLAAGFFFFGARWWVKCLLACYPLLMAVTLVYSGDHYVIDELVGAAFAIGVLLMWRLLRRIRLGRAASASVGDAPHSKDLLGATDRPVDVVQGGGRQADAVRTEAGTHVKPDPRGVRRSQQVNSEVDVGVQQLGRSGSGGAAVRGVDQHHE